MNDEILRLIKLAVVDGKITKQERKVILKKAEKLGEDADEVEMTLEAELASHKNKSRSNTITLGFFKKNKKITTTLILFSIFLILLFITRHNNSEIDREREEKAKAQSEETLKLENIEAKILLGIKEGKPKNELLDLVSQLGSSNSDWTDGQTNGVIDPNHPDERYRGGYDEYWTEKRNIYKEIIMDGITVKEYYIKKNPILVVNSLLAKNQVEEAYRALQAVSPPARGFRKFISFGGGGNGRWNEFAHKYNSALDQINNEYIKKNDFEKAMAIANNYKGIANKVGKNDDGYKFELDFSHKESKIAEIKSHIENSSKTSDKHSVNKGQGNSKRNIDFNNKYLGLYIYQSSKGNTQFYKFINDPVTDGVNILYQDNLSGEVRIENYEMKDFNEQSGKITLQNIRDSKDLKTVFFRKDPESDNGYKLMDNKGTVFSFVSS